MISKPLNVKALENFMIWLRYSDGTEGVIDLKPISEKGIFSAIKNPDIFRKVYIDNETNAIAWSSLLELCPDSLYLRIKGLTFEELGQNRIC